MGSSGNWDHVKFLEDPVFQGYNLVLAGYTGSEFMNPRYNVRTFLDFSTLLPEVDLMICHGGNGTVNLALSSGVPVLGIPSHFEQEWNLQAVEELGFGETLDPSESIKQISFVVRKWIDVRPFLKYEPLVDQAGEYRSSQADLLLGRFEKLVKPPSFRIQA